MIKIFFWFRLLSFFLTKYCFFIIRQIIRVIEKTWQHDKTRIRRCWTKYLEQSKKIKQNWTIPKTLLYLLLRQFWSLLLQFYFWKGDFEILIPYLLRSEVLRSRFATHQTTHIQSFLYSISRSALFVGNEACVKT